MFGLCRRTLEISLLFIVLTTQAQNDLNLVFRTTNDEYIAFEGENMILIECSYPMQMPNTVISLYYDSGEKISNSTTRRVTATLRGVSNSPTVYCNVSGAAQASAQFTVNTIPRDMSPYCVSNYTDGIIQDTAVKLSCYVDTQALGMSEQWRTIDDPFLTVEETLRLNYFGNTRRTVSTVVPTLTNNGTKYTCVTFNVLDASSISASCEVGPILVYENILTYIETGFPDIKSLSHGDSRNFRCVSIPSSNITWTVLEPAGDVGIVVSNGGPVLTVTVPINVTYVGIFSALCIGTLGDNQGVAAIILDIVKPADEQLSTIRTTTTILPTNTGGDSLIIYIICGAVGAVVIISLIVLFTFYWCRRSKRRGNRGNTTKPADPPKQDIEEPEYADPPIGMTTMDDVSNAPGYTGETSDDNSEPDHYDTEGGLYTAVNKQTGKQSNAKFATVVPPSNKTHPQSYTVVDRNDNGEFNLTSDINASVSMGDNRVNISQPPNYATVDKSRHVSINEGSLDDDNSSITDDYSEFQ